MERSERRPWGYYTILVDEESHKVKRIVVNPGQRLSLQRHWYRQELWCVVGGVGKVRLGMEGEPCFAWTNKELQYGTQVDIGIGQWHRVENTGTEPLVFIEIQTGTYFGEDDIERIEDDYGRVT